MRRTLVGLGMLMMLSSNAAMAKQESYVQSHWSAQIQCQDLPGVSHKLEEMATRLEGRVTNSNFDANSGSGNLNLRIPEAALGKFCEEARGLGNIMSQNRSSSDNTSSYLDSKRTMELCEKLSTAHVALPAGASEADKAACETEFKAYLRDKMNSARQSMNSYDQNRGWAELNISLQGPNRAAQPQVSYPGRCGTKSCETIERMPQPQGQTPTIVTTTVEAETCSKGPCAVQLSLGAAALGCLGLLWVRSRRKTSVPPGTLD